MGWIFGLSGQFTDDCVNKVKHIYHTPLHTFQSDNLFINSGGLSSTCFSNINPDHSTGWIICGLGIKHEISCSGY